MGAVRTERGPTQSRFCNRRAPHWTLAARIARGSCEGRAASCLPATGPIWNLPPQYPPEHAAVGELIRKNATRCAIDPPATALLHWRNVSLGHLMNSVPPRTSWAEPDGGIVLA